jgi:hypothetical protein
MQAKADFFNYFLMEFSLNIASAGELPRLVRMISTGFLLQNQSFANEPGKLNLSKPSHR